MFDAKCAIYLKTAPKEHRSQDGAACATLTKAEIEVISQTGDT